jgi:ligand-binding SRPBCC domain-containing protein
MTIHQTTLIDAFIERCFDLSLDLDIEIEAVGADRIQPVAGVAHGRIRANETVSWRARQFGLWIGHTSLISGYDAPVFFEDSMVRGIFRSFVHKHFFRAVSPHQTEMTDEMTFTMPWLLGGPFTDTLIVRRQLLSLLQARNAVIKRRAES